MPKSVKFYFDVISPYAWLAWRPLKALTVKHNVILEPVPILFSALLNVNGQLGPAEIPNKRNWLIKDVMRRANSQGLKVLAPPTHPFNPLLALRVCSIEMDLYKKHDLILKLMDAAWQDGRDISDPVVVSSMVSSVGLNGDGFVSNANGNKFLKDRLKWQTNEAISAGMFGVPTTVVDGELFWGSDTDTMQHIEMKILGKDPVDSAVVARWATVVPSANRKR